MNIYNYPLWLIKPLSLLGKFFPKFVLNIRYYKNNKHFINWNTPQNIQEYCLAKLFDKKNQLQLYADLADKVKVHDFVRERIGNSYLNEMYGYWDSSKKIDFEKLPNKFVLKTNNGCASNLIIKDKSQINEEEIKSKLDYWMALPYGDLSGQIHYSKIKPLILAEKFLEQSKEKDVLPYDYKFFCFKGKPLFVLYYEGRNLNGHITPNMLFDMDWKAFPNAVLRPITKPINQPKSFKEMKECVEKLCKGFDFVRVDFYEINNHPIFGEMTFTPSLDPIRKDFEPLMKLHLQ